MTAVFEAFSQRHGSGGAFLYHKRPQHFRRMILICTTENGESRGDPRTSRLQNSLRLLMIVWWSGALKTSFELWAHPSAFLFRTFKVSSSCPFPPCVCSSRGRNGALRPTGRCVQRWVGNPRSGGAYSTLCIGRAAGKFGG